MGFQKVEFEFPHEDDDSNNDIEIEPSQALEMGTVAEPEVEEKPKEEAKKEPEPKDELEIEVVDDTPEADRNRKKSEAPDELTGEELDQYNEKVQKRIKHFSKGYHDERRAKETAERERTEMENYARNLMQENQRLKGSDGKSREALLSHAKQTVKVDLDRAKTDYKTAYESGNADAVLEAQQALTTAHLRSDK